MGVRLEIYSLRWRQHIYLTIPNMSTDNTELSEDDLLRQSMDQANSGENE